MRARDLNRYLGDLGWRRSPIPPTSITPPGTSAPTAGETLESLAASADGCTLCRLSEKRQTVVFGEGDPKAGVMFIGQGPGAEEGREQGPGALGGFGCHQNGASSSSAETGARAG